MSKGSLKMMRSRFLGLMVTENAVFYARGVTAILLLIFVSSTATASTKVSVEEFNGKNQAQLRASAIKYKGKYEELQLQQTTGATINVGEITKTMLERVGKGLTEGGPFDSPVKKANRGQPGTPGNANILGEIQKITIEIDSADKRPVEVIENVRAEVLSQLALVFKQYVESKQKSGSTDEGLSLVVRNGDSPVRALEVSVDSIVHAFRLAAARVLDPNLAQLLIDCQLQVVLPVVRQHPIATMTPMSIRNDYIEKIKDALADRHSSLFKITEFKITDRADLRINCPPMLITMVEEHTLNAITGAKIPMDVSITTIDKLEELKSTLYISTCFAFGRYLSGHANRVGMEAILSDMNPKTINDLKNAIAEIFYSQNPLSSFTITRTEIHFGANTSREVAGQGLLDVAGWNVPVVSSVVATSMDVLGFVFGNCVPATSRRNLLTNSDNHSARSSSTSTMEGAKIEEI